MRYKDPLFRPPSEAESLIFQISYGCPHNRCLFCPMYKGVKHSVRPLDEVLEEIEKASSQYGSTRRVFLSDGDVLNLDFEYLKSVFLKINRSFSSLTRISMYANGSSILGKTEKELSLLKTLKLHTLYMGLESGSEKILSLVKKGETASGMKEAAVKAQSLGIRMCVFALLGLGGMEYTIEHAAQTADIINQMNPGFFALLRFIKVPGLKMYDNYKPLSEYDSIDEFYRIIKNINLTSTVFRADHTSVPTAFSARLPKDKEILMKSLEQLILSGRLDKKSPGAMPYSL